MSLTAPPPPRTPSPRAKKLVHAYTGSQLGLLIAGLVFMGVGVPLGLVFCRDLPGELSLTMSHETCAGRVIGTQVQQNVRINNRHPTLVSFEYDVGGATYRGESSVLDTSSLSSGVQVEYSPSSPSLSRVAGGTYGTFPVWVGFVLLFPVLGLTLFGGAVRSNRREIRAFRDGQAIEGRITEVGLDRTVKINGRHPHKVSWTFEVQGQSYSGALTSMDPAALAEFQQGTLVTVLYVAENPRANTLWIE
jgi:hypothetical protein